MEKEKNKISKNRKFSFEKNSNLEKRHLSQKSYKNGTERIHKSLEKNSEIHLKDNNEILKKLFNSTHKIDFGEKRKVITITNKGIEEKAEYIEQGELGKGAFSVCYLYESTKDWIQYAAKIVSKEKLSKDKNRQSIIEEITTQQQLDSPKVVKVKIYKKGSLSDLVKKRGH